MGSPFNALPSAKMAFHYNDHGLVAIDKQDIFLDAGNTYQYKIEIHRVFKLLLLLKYQIWYSFTNAIFKII